MVETVAELLLVLAEVQSRRLSTVKRLQESNVGYCEPGLNEWLDKINILREELGEKLEEHNFSNAVDDAVKYGGSIEGLAKKSATAYFRALDQREEVEKN